jgi:hypothetical protein
MLFSLKIHSNIFKVSIAKRYENLNDCLWNYCEVLESVQGEESP